MWQISVRFHNGATALFGVEAPTKLDAEWLAFARAPSGRIAELVVTPILPRSDRNRFS